uniref:TPR_REGION domain-containing protein n=1 Tax=Panagrellus redivivus TaxID=6233 RepID=A0A7E4WDQ6_PANRE
MESQTREEKIAAIAKFMGDGKMASLKGEHDAASEAFSHAAEYAVNVYGEFAEECYEPHFQYGRTLLEIARLASLDTGTDFNTVKEYIEKMASAIEGENAEDQGADSSRVGNADDVPEIEKVFIADKVAEALEENAAELKELAAAKEEEAAATNGSEEAEAGKKESAEAGAEKKETSDAVGKKNESTATAVEKENPDEKKESDEAPEEMEVDEDEDDEEPTPAQAAWEVLEVARCICERQNKEDPEWQRRTGRVLGCLGSLSIIDENFEKAIEDLEQAIKLLKPLEDTDRIISSIHVEVADSHRLLNQFDKAVENYEAAYALLNARLEAVKDQEDNKDAEPAVLEELQELKVLVKDLKGAINDAKDSAADAKKKAALAAAAAKASPSKSDVENSTPVNDISSSVRKVVKRPPPPADDSETESKKPKTDDEAEVSTEAAPAAGDAPPVEASTSAPAAEAAAPTESA